MLASLCAWARERYRTRSAWQRSCCQPPRLPEQTARPPSGGATCKRARTGLLRAHVQLLVGLLQARVRAPRGLPRVALLGGGGLVGRRALGRHRAPRLAHLVRHLVRRVLRHARAVHPARAPGRLTATLNPTHNPTLPSRRPHRRACTPASSGLRTLRPYAGARVNACARAANACLQQRALEARPATASAAPGRSGQPQPGPPSPQTDSGAHPSVTPRLLLPK
jgi:hypothetical protein